MPSESFFIENILKPTIRLSEPVNNVHQNHSTPLDNRSNGNRMAFNNMTNIPPYMMSPAIKGQEYVNAFMSAFMSAAAPRLSQIVQSPDGGASTSFYGSSGYASYTSSSPSDDQQTRSDISENEEDETNDNCRSNVPAMKREKKEWECETCGKIFDRPSLLQRHVRTHTGEKPHVCDVCSKAFSTSSSLNTHKRIHSGEKPHVCNICSKQFTASSNLYYHKLTHTTVCGFLCTFLDH